MKLVALGLIVLLGANLTACDSKKDKQAEPQAVMGIIKQQPEAKDSTIYGVSDEFGMSTFSLITEQGDTLEILREQADGSPAQIAGDVEEGERFAVTLTKVNGENYLNTAINLSLLEQFLKEYKVVNGKLVLNGNDTVVVEQLTDRVFKAKGRISYDVKK